MCLCSKRIISVVSTLPSGVHCSESSVLKVVLPCREAMPWCRSLLVKAVLVCHEARPVVLSSLERPRYVSNQVEVCSSRLQLLKFRLRRLTS